MVRLTGPLFSFKAQKQLGKKLIYKTKSHRSFLTKYNKPGGVKPFTPSEKQQFMRRVYTCAIAKWRALGDDAKKAWDASVKKKNLKMSGWNYFYKLIIPTCAIEICDYPAESDVVRNVVFGNEEFKGTFDEGLPWTGQTIKHQNGDDGDYQKGHTTNRPIVKGVGSHRFIDNGDGTITDKGTGLMWVKDGTGAGCNNGNKFTWTTQLTFAEGLTFAGYSDWRLPNIKELGSVMDFGRIDPAIDPVFINTRSSNYWSSTTYAALTSYAWYGVFLNGAIGVGTKGTSYYVRPVRGGKP